MSPQTRQGAVEQRAPQVTDLDPRLLEPVGRIELTRIVLDHDVPGGSGCCPSCGWVVGGGQRTCPSRSLARSVRERRAVPAWLVHLVDVVPGAIAPRVRANAAEMHAIGDARPGLFDAPERIEPREAQR